MKTSIELTVFFEDTFWVGVFERVYEGKYEVSRVTFGSEPKDYEVYDFILKNFNDLRFSNSLSSNLLKDKKINPKRLQRKIKKETKNMRVGTQAQIAIKLQYEEKKIERKKVSKEKKEAEKKMKFKLRQEKKLRKHKGH